MTLPETRSPAPPQSSAALGRFIRIAVATGLTAVVLWRSDPGAVGRTLADAAPGPILIAVLLVLVDRALMAHRWLVLLCPVPAGRRPRLSGVLRIFFVSTFVGTFLPASVGGDAVRAVALARLNVPGADAVASVFLDRVLGVLSILIMAVVGIALAGDVAREPIVVIALGATAAACAGIAAIVFSARAVEAIDRIIGTMPGDRLRRVLRKLLNAVRAYAGYQRQLAGVLVSSVAVQVLRTVQAYYLGVSLGIAAGPLTYFAFIPLILLIMLLPITINGLGTSQAAFVWFFGRAGVPDAEAFALSVLFVALGIVGNLPGAFLFMTRWGHSPREDSGSMRLWLVVALAAVAAVAVALGTATILRDRPRPEPETRGLMPRDEQVRRILFHELQPVKLLNCRLERFGEPHDGGYLMCGNLLGAVGAGYSYGISGYDGWGCDISRRLGVTVHQYDCFDPKRPVCSAGRTVFHDECVAGQRTVEDGRVFETVQNQVAANGDGTKRLVVKMDVEGAEWDTFSQMPDKVLDRIDQLSVEFHHVGEERFVRVVQRLKIRFHVVHLHFNNFSCHGGVAPFPAWAYEVLFVNKRIGVLDPSGKATLPHPLDARNNPDVGDCPPVPAG